MRERPLLLTEDERTQGSAGHGSRGHTAGEMRMDRPYLGSMVARRGFPSLVAGALLLLACSAAAVPAAVTVLRDSSMDVANHANVLQAVRAMAPAVSASDTEFRKGQLGN